MICGPQQLCTEVVLLRVVERPGGPWSFGCVFEYTSAIEGRIWLAPRAPTPSEWRAVRRTLLDMGVRAATWERHIVGDEIAVRIRRRT